MQGRNQVKVFFPGFVVKQEFALQQFGKQLSGNQPPAVRVRLHCPHSGFERVVRGPRIATGKYSDVLDRLRAHFNRFVAEPALLIRDGPPQQPLDLFRRERLQHVHARPRKQRRNHFKRRILRRRAYQNNVAGFDVRQERVLLRLVESMHLVHEHDCSPPGPPRMFRRGPHFLDFPDPPQHRAERYKFRMRHSRNQSRQRCLPASRRPPQNHRADIVPLDLRAQGLSRPKQRLLSGKLIQRFWTHPLRQRLRRRTPPILRLEFREKTHPGSNSVSSKAASSTTNFKSRPLNFKSQISNLRFPELRFEDLSLWVAALVVTTAEQSAAKLGRPRIWVLTTEHK